MSKPTLVCRGTSSLRLLCLAAAFALPTVQAQGPSETSVTASVTPVAVSVGVVSATGVALTAASSGLLSGDTKLVVVSVDAVGDTMDWVLKRTSDGACLSLKTTGRLAMSGFVYTGIAVTTSVIGAGTVLSAAGRVIAFIPNEIGKALLHNEQVSP